MEEDAHGGDRFHSILKEMGPIASSFRDLRLSSTFLNEPPPSPDNDYDYDDAPILISTLPQTPPPPEPGLQPVPALGLTTQPPPPPPSVSDVQPQPAPASADLGLGFATTDAAPSPNPPAVKSEPAAARFLPATFQSRETFGSGSTRKPSSMEDRGLGFSNQVPPPPPSETVRKDKGKQKRSGSSRGRARRAQIASLSSESVKQEVPEPAAKASSGHDKEEAAVVPPDLFDVVLKFAKKPDFKRFANMDILEVAAMKGIHFDPPCWHRPGGYD